MKQKILLAALLFTISLCLTNCKKACPGQNYSNVPSIQLERITSAYGIDSSGVNNHGFGGSRFLDTIILNFTDGDKDLLGDAYSGGNIQCSDSDLFYNLMVDSCLLKLPNRNLFMIDSRDNGLVTYGLTTNPSEGAFYSSPCGYDGTIQIQMHIYSNKCYSNDGGPACRDTATYRIFVRDRAGHFSKAIETPPIIVDVAK